jgi:hypothetical protein
MLFMYSDNIIDITFEINALRMSVILVNILLFMYLHNNIFISLCLSQYKPLNEMYLFYTN